MSAQTVENLFKAVFFFAILVFIALIIAIFLMIIKILFLFIPEGITILGIKMTPAILGI